MTSISLLDYAMFLTETRENPRHVAGLMIFEPPAGAGKDFVARLVDEMREVPPTPPFSWKLSARLGAMPVWEDTDPDMRHHVRHLAVPRPGGLEELLRLVSELHSEMLDRSRPVWEFYLIEGLPDGQFALYSKIHHAYADGATMSHWLDGSLSYDRNSDKLTPVWALPGPAGRRSRHTSLTKVLEALGKTAGRQLITVAELYTMILKHSLKALHLTESKVPIPFTAPRTILNQRLTAARSIAAAAIDLERLRRAGKAAGGTINDVVLTLCDAALTRYLEERDELPPKPLIAEMPVNLRDEKSNDGGNVLSILLVEMARGKMSIRQRFDTISDSSHTVIKEFSGLSNDAVMTYTLVVQILAQIGDSLGLADKLPPLGNLVISNVPGPRRSLYLRGARLTEIYPLSTVAPGTVMNITVFSYAGKLLFGLVGGRDAVPDLQQLADFIPKSLVELEDSLGLARSGSDGEKADAENTKHRAKAARGKKTTPAKRTEARSKPASKRKKTTTKKSRAGNKPPSTRKKTTRKKTGVGKKSGRPAQTSSENSEKRKS